MMNMGMGAKARISMASNSVFHVHQVELSRSHSSYRALAVSDACKQASNRTHALNQWPSPAIMRPPTSRRLDKSFGTPRRSLASFDDHKLLLNSLLER